MALFIFFFTVIFGIVLFTFYYSCVVFVLFMAWFNVLFSFFYSCIVFVSLYKAYESIVLGRHGKIGGSGRVNRVCGSIGSLVKTGQSSCGSGRVGFTRIFQTSFFFFFNYRNKSMTTCLKRMNKIN